MKCDLCGGEMTGASNRKGYFVWATNMKWCCSFYTAECLQDYQINVLPQISFEPQIEWMKKKLLVEPLENRYEFHGNIYNEREWARVMKLKAFL